MTQSLFRQEAVDHQQQRLFGEVLVAWPLPFAWYVAGAVFATCGLLLFAVTGEYTRKVHVEGFLAPDRGLVKIASRETAAIAERRVAEGQPVKRGDVLFVLASDRSTDTGVAAADVALRESRRRRDLLLEDRGNIASIAKSQAEQLRTKIASMADESRRVDREIDLQKQRLETYRQTTARYGELVKGKFVSPLQLQTQAGLQLEQEAGLEGIERRKLSLERDVALARQQLTEVALKSQGDLANLERQVSALEQDIADAAARKGGLVVAPVDGVATAVQGDAGQIAVPGVPLVTVIPTDSKVEAKLLVPAAAIGFIESGQQVQLRYAAYPYQRFGHQRGTVTQISRSVVLPSEMVAPVLLKAPVYIVTVRLENTSIRTSGSSRPLQTGMTLEADVLLDRRPIYHWFIEPILSLHGKA